MRKLAFKIYLVYFSFKLFHAFHVHQENAVETIKINYEDTIDDFPSEFWIQLKSNESYYSFRLSKSNKKITENNKIRLWKNEKDEIEIKSKRLQAIKSRVYELYSLNETHGTATLIQNENEKKKSFRFMATIFDGRDKVIEVKPVLVKRSKRDSNLIESNNHQHYSVVESRMKAASRKKRYDLSADRIESEMTSKLEKLMENFKRDQKSMNQRRRRKRDLVKQSVVDYYVELLVVTDKSIYDMHSRFYNTNDSELIHSNMRFYYAHLINGVNERFKHSFRNDEDMRIHILLTNILSYDDISLTNWTNPEICGINMSRNFNRYILHKDCVIDRFKSYMNQMRSSFKFHYDHAISLVDNDLFDTPTEHDTGEGVLAVSYTYGICSYSHEYSISQDFGGFTSSFFIAHEIGHNLGASNHDGERENDTCLASGNFIMTPSFDSISNNFNLFDFSPCSVEEIKAFLFYLNFGFCLRNYPNDLVEESLDLEDVYHGEIFDANDQCKMSFGEEAFFNQMTDSMCSQLYCYPSRNSTYMYTTGPQGVGAAEGTVCGYGRICLKNQCVAHSLAPKKYCLFGDLFVRNENGSYGVSCEESIIKLLATNVSLKMICTLSYFESQCCSTCRKYMQYSSEMCYDLFSDCEYYKSRCNESEVIYKRGYYALYKQFCPVSCGLCKVEHPTCKSFAKACLNGATCVDNLNGFGFTCQCSSHFYGASCEYERVDYKNYLTKQKKKSKAAIKKVKTNIYGESLPNFEDWSLYNTMNNLNFSLPSVNSTEEFLLMNAEIKSDCMVNAIEFYAYQIPLEFEVKLESRISVQFWKFDNCGKHKKCSEYLINDRNGSFDKSDLIRFSSDESDLVFSGDLIKIKHGYNYFRFIKPFYVPKGSIVYINQYLTLDHRLSMSLDHLSIDTNYSDYKIDSQNSKLEKLDLDSNIRFYLRVHVVESKFTFFGSELITLEDSDIELKVCTSPTVVLINSEITKESTTFVGFESFGIVPGVIKINLLQLNDCKLEQTNSCSSYLKTKKFTSLVEHKDYKLTSLGTYLVVRGYNYNSLDSLDLNVPKGSLILISQIGTPLTLYTNENLKESDLSCQGLVCESLVDTENRKYKINFRLIAQ